MRSVRIATGILCQLFIASALFAAELAVPQQVTDWRKGAETAVQENDFQTAVNLHAKIASSFPALAMDAQSDIAVTHLLNGNKSLILKPSPAIRSHMMLSDRERDGPG